MPVLGYETLLAPREGLTRDLPPGDNEDLRWVTNSATLIFGERDAVLVDTFTTVEQNYLAQTTEASRQNWAQSLARLKDLEPQYVVAGHTRPGQLSRKH